MTNLVTGCNLENVEDLGTVEPFAILATALVKAEVILTVAMADAFREASHADNETWWYAKENIHTDMMKDIKKRMDCIFCDMNIVYNDLPVQFAVYDSFTDEVVGRFDTYEKAEDDARLETQVCDELKLSRFLQSTVGKLRETDIASEKTADVKQALRELSQDAEEKAYNRFRVEIETYGQYDARMDELERATERA